MSIIPRVSITTHVILFLSVRVGFWTRLFARAGCHVGPKQNIHLLFEVLQVSEVPFEVQMMRVTERHARHSMHNDIFPVHSEWGPGQQQENRENQAIGQFRRNRGGRWISAENDFLSRSIQETAITCRLKGTTMRYLVLCLPSHTNMTPMKMGDIFLGAKRA